MSPLITTVLLSAIIAGAVIVIVAIGELLAEKTGVLNLGLEGIIAMGAVTAVIAVNGYVANPYFGLMAAMIIGTLFGFLFAIATVTIKANQVLCGLALNFIGLGLSGQIGASYAGQPTVAIFERIRIPFLGDIPVIGDFLFNHNILVYLSYLVLPFAVSWLLSRTRHGMNIRAVGENPAAADAAGINVDKIRFLYTVLGGTLAAVGGAYITLALTPVWAEGISGGKGWIAIALVIFAGWRPFGVIIGALLFGAVISLGYVGQIRGWPIDASFLSMLPYLGTILLMLLPIILRRNKEQRRLGLAPTALGIPYSRKQE